MTRVDATDADPSARPAVAFERLADEHLDRAYRLACAILRDSTEAQDATHDAFIRAWRNWSSLRDPARFEAWFDRILVNTCRDRLRHRSRRQMHDISNEVIAASGDAFAATHDRDVLGTALAELSIDHRIVVAMRFYRDLQVDEIAARLDIPSGTVQSRLHYALRDLHGILDGLERKEAAR